MRDRDDADPLERRSPPDEGECRRSTHPARRKPVPQEDDRGCEQPGVEYPVFRGARHVELDLVPEALDRSGGEVRGVGAGSDQEELHTRPLPETRDLQIPLLKEPHQLRPGDQVGTPLRHSLDAAELAGLEPVVQGLNRESEDRRDFRNGEKRPLIRGWSGMRGGSHHARPGSSLPALAGGTAPPSPLGLLFRLSRIAARNS